MRKNALIVYAHPEPKSYCGSLKNKCQETLESIGYKVEVSDLYEMGYNPVEEPTILFTQLSDKSKDHFRLNQELDYAYANGTLVKSYRDEVDKVNNSDLVIFIFPFWWSTCPAIMKGWLDITLIHNVAFSYNNFQIYANGLWKGKKTMIVTTTGGEESHYTKEGPHKMTVEERLEHLTYGTLAFTGMSVLPTIAINGVTPMSKKEYLTESLSKFEETIKGIDKIKPIYN